MREIVTFSNEKVFREKAEMVVRKHREKIKSVLPNSEILHVGSTAVKGSLTKGDVDLQVRVSQRNFKNARELLKQIYKINEGSIQTNEFCAFEKPDEILPLGIQLTVVSSKLDHFWKFTQFLREHTEYLDAYNELKKKYNGKSMDEYREEKSILIEDVFSSEKYSLFINNLK